MINAAATHSVLQQALQPISLTPGTPTATDTPTVALQSCALLSATNGALLLHAGTPAGTLGASPSAALNNLRMMALLCKDKWDNDTEEEEPSQEDTATQPSVYTHAGTRIHNYALEGLHAAVARIPGSELLLLCIAPAAFPYGLLARRAAAVLDACAGLRGYSLGQ